MSGIENQLTIGQLAEAVAKALEAGAVESPSGRVRAVPDVRTLRYYTTLGLLDRPERLEGRTAYYGRRHVLQLVAIKRLQSAGLPLAQIQARLLNASNDDLARLAQLPADGSEQLSSLKRRTNQEPSPVPAAREPDRVFWKMSPRAQSPAAAGAGPATSESSPPANHPTFVGVPLSGDVSLLVQGARPVDEEDLAALRAAAQPLLEMLRHRRLLP